MRVLLATALPNRCVRDGLTYVRKSIEFRTHFIPGTCSQLTEVVQPHVLEVNAENYFVNDGCSEFLPCVFLLRLY